MPRSRRGSVLFLAFSDSAGDEVSLYFPFFLSSGVYFVFKFWRLIGVSGWWWVLDFLHLGEGFFSGFPGYKDQSALSFLKGRSSRFLHFFAVCSIMSRQETFLYLTSVWLRFVFIRFYKVLGFSNIFGYYCEHLSFCGKDFLFVRSSLFRKRCVFYALYPSF